MGNRYIQGSLLGFVLSLASSCSLISGLGLEEEVLQIEVELASAEAACLVAERLALDFTSIDRDPLRPKARALNRGDGRFRIQYQRVAGRSFLPVANGHFLRDHYLHDGRPPALGSFLGSPLGQIKFIRTPTTSTPGGVIERVTVDVDPLDSSGARVVISCSGGNYGTRRRRAGSLLRLLSFVGSLKQALALAASDHVDQALSCIDHAVGDSFGGLSSLHDPLVARAYVLRARLLLDRGQRPRAEQALRQARLIAPSSSELAELHSQLMDDRARPELVPDALEHASLMSAPGSLRERRLQTHRRQARSYSSFNSSMIRGMEEFSEEDWSGAEAWANRALDRSPGHPEARILLADALEKMGKPLEGRDLRLLAFLSRDSNPTQLHALADNLALIGDASLGLRWLIRFRNEHPDLLASAKSRILFGAVGLEHCVRAMRIEGLGLQCIPLLLSWMQEEPSHQRWFLARLFLANVLREAERSEVFDSTRVETVHEHGASGVRSLHTASPFR